MKKKVIIILACVAGVILLMTIGLMVAFNVKYGKTMKKTYALVQDASVENYMSDGVNLKSEEVPDIVKDSFVTMEDRNFYEHDGISTSGYISAKIRLLLSSKSNVGGNTITEQMASNIFIEDETGGEAELMTMTIARITEEKFSKEDILAFYVNSLDFGNGYKGIESAAEGYFGKKLSEMSISEQVYLCGIANNVELYDPYTNLENGIQRRDRCLEQLLSEDKLTKEEYENAIKEEIVIKGEQQ